MILSPSDRCVAGESHARGPGGPCRTGEMSRVGERRELRDGREEDSSEQRYPGYKN